MTPTSATTTVAPPSSARIWASTAPTIVFLVVNWRFGVPPAAAAATVVAAWIVARRIRRSERIGWVLPATLGYVLVRGTVSALTRSEDVYFGIGIAMSATVALGVLASAATTRPAALYAIPLVANYDEPVRNHPTYRRVARHVTASWAFAELAVTVWEAQHLRAVGPAEFVGRRAFIGWPFMAFVVFWLIFYVRFRLDPIGRPLGRARRAESA